MLLQRLLRPALLVASLVAGVACAGHVRPSTALPQPEPEFPRQAAVPAPPVADPAPPRTPAVDIVADVIAESDRQFDVARSELQAGHLDSARAAFNRAVEVLLESPGGGRNEPRIREHFDALVQRISALEVAALAQGDGFVEKRYEPATLDDILAATSVFATPIPSPATAAAVASDTAKYDIDIPHDNPRVLAFVQLFTTGLKNYLQDGLSRGARFLPMIRQVFQEEGVPLDLAYVPLVESAFKVNAFSRTKAKGLWQFMQATGRENGLRTDWYIDERSEPEKATRAAAKYLKTLYGMFSDWSLALASYNAGPGTVQNAIKRSHGVRDFWELAANRRNFRQETRDYVPLIMAATIIAKNPVQYGLDVPAAQEDPRFETVRVSSVVDLRRVAEWADVPVEAIQVLNPELRRWTTPVRADEYVLRVPEGKADLVSQRLADAADETSLNWHTVRKGETLASIARKLRVSRNDLAEANYLSAKARVTPGQQLVIPRAPSLLVSARADDAVPPPVETPTASRRATPRQVDAVSADTRVSRTPTRATTPVKTTYRVKSGDTLGSIARSFGTTVSSLQKWNRIRGNVVRVGDRLTIYSTRAAASTN